MTKERELLELKIGWDLSPYSQEEIVEALSKGKEDKIIDYLLSLPCNAKYAEAAK